MNFNPKIVNELIDNGFTIIPLNEEIISAEDLKEMREEILNANLSTEKSINVITNQEIAEKHPETIKLKESDENQKFEKCVKYLKEISMKFKSIFATLKLEEDWSENKASILTKNASLPKHLDNDGSNEEDKRKISIILYLNPDWEEKDGGELILYTLEDQIIKISPSQCILVFFSDQIAHQVEIIHSEMKRLTLTIWMKTQIKNYLLFNYDKDQFYNIMRKHFPQYLY